MATPGVDKVVALSGMSVLDSNSMLANAGVAYVILKDWGVRLKEPGQDLRSIVQHIGRELQDAAGRPRPSRWCRPPSRASAMPAASQMQVEQKDGSFDYVKLQNATDNLIRNASTQSALTNLVTSFRAGAPHVRVEIDRSKAETLKVSIGDVFSHALLVPRFDLRQPLQQVRPEPAWSSCRPIRSTAPSPRTS